MTGDKKDEREGQEEGGVPETGSLEDDTPGLDPGRESAAEAARVFEQAEEKPEPK